MLWCETLHRLLIHEPKSWSKSEDACSTNIQDCWNSWIVKHRRVLGLMGIRRQFISHTKNLMKCVFGHPLLSYLMKHRYSLSMNGFNGERKPNVWVTVEFVRWLLGDSFVHLTGAVHLGADLKIPCDQDFEDLASMFRFSKISCCEPRCVSTTSSHSTKRIINYYRCGHRLLMD